MDSQVFDLVTKFNQSGEKSATAVTYITLYGTQISFNVSPERLGEFFSGLCEIVDEDINSESSDDIKDYTGLGLPFAEVINKSVPIIVHLKMSFNVSNIDRKKIVLISDEFIIRILYQIQNVIATRFTISPNMSELIATIETSNSWTTPSGSEAISIRIMFPYAQVDPNYQRGNLRRYFLEAICNSRILNELPVVPNESFDSIFQPLREYLPMYRCKELEMESPMILSHIYGRITQEDIIGNRVDNMIDYSNNDLLKVFNPMYYQYIHHRITPSNFLETNTDVKYWLPMFLSIYYWSGELPLKVSPYTESGSPNSDSALPEGVIAYEEKSVTSRDPLTMALYLLNMLSVDRINEEPFWIDIGQILSNITKGMVEGLNLFIQHSTRATVANRDKKACTELYKSFRPNQFTVRTLACYAKKDSPRAYGEWHKKWSHPSIMAALSGDHDDVAEALYRVFWLEYICTSHKDDIWYVFDGHRLRRQDDGVDLRLAISTYLIPLYKRMKDSLNTNNDPHRSNEDKKQNEIYTVQIAKLCKSLKQAGYESSCIRMARKKFYVHDFQKYKDADPFKTGWDNCIVRCLGNIAYTIDGKPEDYITKSTYMKFRSDLHWNHPLVVRYMNWMAQVFPDKDLRHYVLKDFASFLYGKNAEKLLRAWSGDGDNSKTMVAKAIQIMLGDYCVDFPPSMLTGKGLSSSGPTPELAQAEGAHVGFVPETEHDEKIREGTVKRYTGGDRFFARMCRDNGGSLEAFFKLIIMCNSIPEFTAISKALRNRFLYIPFLGNWCDDAPDDPAEQFRLRKFKKDIYFENQIPELAQAGAWVMIQYFTYYKNEGLKVPPIVTEYTNQHWSENDPILGFINENIIESWVIDPMTQERIRETTKSFTCAEAHSTYTRWHRRTYPNGEIASLPIFKQDLILHIGKPGKNKRWWGLEIVKPNTVNNNNNPLNA